MKYTNRKVPRRVFFTPTAMLPEPNIYIML